MSAIRILSDRVANQIAAGEVVERPASIVKELIENSLDAGATRMEVEFRNGGRSHIRVEDNGRGMSRDDALLSLERHSTSKIREAVDLDSILSFGFRGEALPSIASVSRFSLQTRDEASENGTEIVINGGKVLHVRDCGMPVGTRIVVSNLFNSVPARRKFLKSDATEAAHIIHQTRLHALACPEVSFSLFEDGRPNFQSPVCRTLADRIAEVFGRQLASNLINLEAEEGGLRLHGLISRPGVARSTRHEMVTFVNRRPVDSRTLAYALLESYHTHIPKGRYPMAFVFLEIDPSGVDVNVHPAKREIRFREETKVRGFTIRTVLAALRGWQAKSSLAMPVSASAQAPASGAIAPPHPAPSRVSAPGGGTVPSSPARNSSPLPPSQRPAPPSPPRDVPASAQAQPVWRCLGQLDGGYSLFETSSGLVVLDRRAAAERVWYERLLDAQETDQIECQQLLLPVPVEFDPLDAAVLVDSLEFLDNHGLTVAPFGRNLFRIEAVPPWLVPGEAESFLRDVVGLMRSGRTSSRDLRGAREELARVASVRAAATTGSAVLAATALDQLVVDLLRCATPHTSPAGRPVFIEISRGELARRFHKTNLRHQPDLG